MSGPTFARTAGEGGRDPSLLPPEPVDFAIRVGVTGTRAIPSAAEPQVRAAVSEVLARVRTVAERIAADAQPQGLWAAPQGRVVPLLRVVSPLAEGADRLVAEEALRLGFALEVPLPFQQTEYERDFGENTDRFRALLAHAGGRVLALDGGRGADEWRSYEAVGRLVVRNCDLLIAIWDPDVAAKGRGGTLDTIRFAAEEGPPVWWIHAAGSHPPAMIERMTEILRLATAPTGADALARLDAHLGALLQPPPVGMPVARTLLERTVATLQQLSHAAPPGLQGYLRARGPRGPGLRLYDRLMHLAAQRAPFRAPETGLVAAHDVPAAQADMWTPVAARAGRFALRWADRSRTSGVIVVAFATIAALATLVGLLSGADGANALAAVSILVVGALVIVERVFGWRERRRDARRLAEAARGRQALARLGWAPPRADLDGGADTPVGWVDWYVAAIGRAAPLPTGWLGGGRLEQECRELDRLLVAGQATHHFNRHAASREAARILDDVALGGFAGAGACLVIAALAGGTPGSVFGIAAVVLAVLAAATLALRAIGPLDAVAADSEARESLAERIEARLAAVERDQPLASQDLAADLARLLATP